MNDNRREIWIFGIIQSIGTILTIVLVCQKLKIERIIVAISFLIILSSGNMAALCVSRLKFYKDLWSLSKIAMRVMAAIIGIIVSTGLLFILDHVYQSMSTIVR